MEFGIPTAAISSVHNFMHSICVVTQYALVFDRMQAVIIAIESSVSKKHSLS